MEKLRHTGFMVASQLVKGSEIYIFEVQSLHS